LTLDRLKRSPFAHGRPGRDETVPYVDMLHLVTWNIWATNANWPTRRKALVASLTGVNPDIIALQETSHPPGEATQTADLASAVGLNHHVHATPPRPAHHRGLGVISRWPITTHDVIALPAGGHPDEHRIALHATITTPRGPFPLITTHLNWRLDDSAVRQQQVRTIIETVAALDYQHLPAVVCGDLNASPESDEVRMLTGYTTVPIPGVVFQDAWTVAGDDSPGYTWTRSNPHAARERFGPARLDYILIQWHPDKPGPILNATILDGSHAGTWASDHAGLHATLAAP
jgi:endonuclease/exonuclease/phosphatase family metal-dependent hydrolase